MYFTAIIVNQYGYKVEYIKIHCTFLKTLLQQVFKTINLRVFLKFLQRKMHLTASFKFSRYAQLIQHCYKNGNHPFLITP